MFRETNLRSLTGFSFGGPIISLVFLDPHPIINPFYDACGSRSQVGDFARKEEQEVGPSSEHAAPPTKTDCNE